MSERKRHSDDTMLYVVSCDIPDDRRRARVHSALTGFGTWVQYSVFECFLDKKLRMKLEARLHLHAEFVGEKQAPGVGLKLGLKRSVLIMIQYKREVAGGQAY